MVNEKNKPFDKKMVEAQNAAKEKDWKRFKTIFKEICKDDERKLLEPFDLFGNTAIHAVARSGNPQDLTELLDMLPENEKKNVVRMPNSEGNSLLHEAIFHIDEGMVSAIMDFEKQYGIGEKPERTLLELPNKVGETPPSRAASFGKLKMMKHMAKYAKVQLQSTHFPPTHENKRPILHTCVLGLCFDVAIWLVKMDKKLAQEKDDEGLTCLHLLSKMPMAFTSQATLGMGTATKLIYKLLPKERDELDDDGSNVLIRSTRDTESGQQDDETENLPKSIISSINYAFWKLLAKACIGRFDVIGKIWEKKKRHMFAEQLADLLVKIDDSWLESYNNQQRSLNVRSNLPSNVTEKKKDVELKAVIEKMERIFKEMKQREKQKKQVNVEEVEKDEQKNQTNDKSTYTPLLLAAASGIIEVVKKIIEENPEAISHVSKDGLNILHMAVKHRQLEIFQLIERSTAFESLKPRIANVDCRTILHQAASMEYYREQVLPGVAYQLQDELKWYHRVREIVPDHYLMHCDKEGLTAGDLLDIEHAEMHDQAKQWMKETAQSCSTVAVLIAGVVFAAAYAIPGGSEGGTPVFHNSTAFRVFTTMDVVALAGSLGSVVMFLSILTSSFDLWDFHVSLPRKLKLGFLMLFFSLISTMLAFAATILLTIRMEGNKKTTTFIYSLAFVIVCIFGLTQFPLYKMFQDQVNQCLQLWETKDKKN